MNLNRIIVASLSVCAVAPTAFAASDDNSSCGGCLLLLVIIGLVIYAFSKVGRYKTGFRHGTEGRPKSLYHQLGESEETKEAYREGYQDGQLSRLRDKDE
jgi:hypothetical protein